VYACMCACWYSQKYTVHCYGGTQSGSKETWSSPCGMLPALCGISIPVHNLSMNRSSPLQMENVGQC